MLLLCTKLATGTLQSVCGTILQPHVAPFADHEQQEAFDKLDNMMA